MSEDLNNLVREAMELTGASAPTIAEENAPILTEETLGETSGESFYLVGLIGGKEVGKSALVNALVGEEITRQTAYGAGTETVIAYAHESQAGALRALLQREAPNQFSIVTHRRDDLSRQVLLDLPDIDSHWAGHVELTRRMLRHMLFPIWMQSIEKYADLAPQKLLSQVAAGNDPSNFVFVLNKADQLLRPGTGNDAAEELRRDFAQRVARTLSLTHSPKVWLISAIHSHQHDLPELKKMLSMQRSTHAVEQSKDLALRRRALSVAQWLDSQRLPQRAERLARLEEMAQETLASRVGVPILEGALPRLADDPAQRMALVDAVMSQRIQRWPIVNVVHTLLAPITALVRRSLSGHQQAAALSGPDRLVTTYLEDIGPPITVGGDTSGLASLIQSSFAMLQQTNPLVSEMYGQRKLWEGMTAEMAAADLRQRLTGVIERQRTEVQKKLATNGWLGAPFRWLLTIGALIWFPVAQPLLESVLLSGWSSVVTNLALEIVQIFSVPYLLQTAVFLALYFATLWLIIRYRTHRRVQSLLTRWRRAGGADASMNLAQQTLEWLDEMLTPIRRQRERVEALAKRSSELRESLQSRTAA